ncbi:LytR/AlgR family response regulator transcription factor [Pelagicoccus mobilis]|uniref:Response regulator transcription factor n=1 Tax=Pelagicoccus mobilis TaxID=415221 RepID=A0A934RYZ6_9BACT|nr:LytTR family DNA-binding domain-containing protein [Pelagicoccus mobilis]MBK1876912.1 response regulator transcription factor [Pelagicoccus mobilis]
MRAFIVEDSRLARQELKGLLKAFDSIEIVGEAENADEAIAQIKKLQPELLFLDIHLPGKDGFEILEELDEAPQVIFTTAYDQYALKAFEYNALDYLQKPIQTDRLATALEKMTQSTVGLDGPASRDASSHQPAPLTSASQVFVKDGDRCWFVKVADIRLLEIEGSYTRIHFADNRPTIPKTLNQLEERLDPGQFFRANRQQIVNLKHISGIEPWFSGGLKLTLSAGEEVEISRRQASKFKELTSL